ncbi:HAD-IC family P-type ATPase [Candidatus Woesearchaeota archaeon]|nr:HAD-IC family P-type ATPase [Candidatus Woesearchaeota archaeon]
MPDSVAWYSKPVSSVLSELGSSEKGLDGAEAEKRLKQYGPNEIKKAKKDTALKIFFRQFKAFIVWVLLAAAGISLFIGHSLEFYVISAIIGIIVLISFFEEFKASKDMDALIKMTSIQSTVLRGGAKVQVPSRDLTVGDILILKRGQIVGADARIIEANSLKADESALTGESLAVQKSASDLKGTVALAQQANMVFSGTSITNGDALAVVVSVGSATEIGKISSMIKGIKEEKTPLQKRLDKLTKQLSFLAFIMAIAVFFIGLAHGEHWSVMLIFSMAMIVSGIPESLPTVVAVTLATGMKNMAKKNAIVKRLPAVETLGTCTVICTDKTGTLTQNKMVVENIFTSDAELKVTGEGYAPEGLFLKDKKEMDVSRHKTVHRLLEIGVLCNNSDINQKEGGWEVDGEATEGALITLSSKARIHRADYHEKFPRKTEHPFDPDRKCMSVVHLYEGKQFVFAKGAPESILKRSAFYLHEGSVKKMTGKSRDMFLAKNKEYAEKGLRVLSMAFKPHKGSFDIKNVESGLIFVGLVSIRDPPAPGVKESIAQCRSAGVKVVMITGDNELTARAIARELGIFTDYNYALSGSELDSLDEAELIRKIDKITVYARVTPAHKLRIVETLQKTGNIVAMTGDGVNDAPALKKANIGIAMGLRGTEVAKESAELVLKDDNFTTIVSAVESGRTIYENIRKFIFYLLLGNFAEVLMLLIAVLVGISLPLTALMILFLNLVTSDLQALGLSVENASPNIMKQRPRSPKEGILSEYLMFRIAELVPMAVLGTIVLFIWEIVVKGAGIEKAQTVAFATIIFFELFHALNAKSWSRSVFSKEFFSNMYLIGSIALSAALTVIVIYWAPLQRIFGTTGLTVMDWVPVVCVSASILAYVELKKTFLQAELKEQERLQVKPETA